MTEIFAGHPKVSEETVKQVTEKLVALGYGAMEGPAFIENWEHVRRCGHLVKFRKEGAPFLSRLKAGVPWRKFYGMGNRGIYGPCDIPDRPNVQGDPLARPAALACGLRSTMGMDRQGGVA